MLSFIISYGGTTHQSLFLYKVVVLFKGKHPYTFQKKYAAGETADLFLELLAFLWGESVGFGDEWDDIDFLMQPFHELDVQGLQSACR